MFAANTNPQSFFRFYLCRCRGLCIPSLSVLCVNLRLCEFVCSTEHVEWLTEKQLQNPTGKALEKAAEETSAQG